MTSYDQDTATKIFLDTQKQYQEELERLKVDGDNLVEQLNDMLNQKVFLEDKIRSMCKLTPTLKGIKSEAIDLVNTINDISESSEKISGKIRSLDEARNRVEECQHRVSDLIDLKLCSQGVESAILEEDYETGAALVHRFLSMDQSLLKRTANDMNVSNTLKFVRTLEDAASQLRHIVKHKFNESVESEDLPSIERFFKIFPMLGMYEEGIEKFCTYSRTKIAATADKNIKSAISTPQTDKRYGVIYGDTLMLLMEGLAQLLNKHQPVIETYYGPGKLLSAIKVLQKEIDKQVKRVFFEWDKTRQIQRKLEQITDYKRMSSSSSFSKLEKIDPKELDVIIGEMALMHFHCELYIKFIKKRVWADADVGIPDQTQKENVKQNLEKLLKDSEFCQFKHDLLSRYLRFEQYFMEESIAKAIHMDVLDLNHKNSSMADESFFLVKKCIRRSISTGSLDGICTVINNACSVLESDFCETLKMKLRQGYPSGYVDIAYSALQTSIQQGRFQSGDTEQSKTSFIVALNNADASTEYVDSLRLKVTGEIETALPNMNSNEKGKLESCLSGLLSVTTNLKEIINYGIKQLHSTVIKPRVNPWVDTFLNYNHELSEDEFSAYEAGETFVARLISNLDTLLSSFKEVLTPANYELFTQVLTSEVTQRFEEVIMKTTYSRLGGLLLDKEVRMLASFITSATNWSVRDKFAKLTQMATVLNLDQVSEIRDYDGEFTWWLTPSELRNVMSLRIDFKMDEIKKLRL